VSEAGGVPTWEIAVAAGAELGERPVWDAGAGCLIWVDIKAGRLHRYRPRTGNEVAVDLGTAGPGDRPVAIGAAAHRRRGGYVLAAADGFRLVGPDGQPQAGPVRPDGMGDDVRFNDAACDPAGRFWAGTVGLSRQPGAGALYRLDPDGTVTTVLTGVTESNGLGWSPDGGTFYYIDSGEPEPGVRAFGFDAATGALGPARDLVRFPGGDAVPDGLTVDGSGAVWVAVHGGAAVHAYSPAGELLAALPVPVSYPTCPAFGGDGLSQLYVTTAWEGMDERRRAAEPLAGHVLRTRPGTAGQPATPFAG
jgi:sugar lactone lactonase YvrE